MCSKGFTLDFDFLVPQSSKVDVRCKMEEKNRRSIIHLPIEIIYLIFTYFNFHEIAHLRPVCQLFNAIAKHRLNCGAAKLMKEIKGHLKVKEDQLAESLPKDEIIEKNTRLESLKYIINNVYKEYGNELLENKCCFIAGKVIDKGYAMLRYVLANPFTCDKGQDEEDDEWDGEDEEEDEWDGEDEEDEEPDIEPLEYSSKYNEFDCLCFMAYDHFLHFILPSIESAKFSRWKGNLALHYPSESQALTARKTAKVIPKRTRRMENKVCQKLNVECQRSLNLGIEMVIEKSWNRLVGVKAEMPQHPRLQREHKLHSQMNFLQTVYESLVDMYILYADEDEEFRYCFIPGKVIDKANSLLTFAGSSKMLKKRTAYFVNMCLFAMLHFKREISSLMMDTSSPTPSLSVDTCTFIRQMQKEKAARKRIKKQRLRIGNLSKQIQDLSEEILKLSQVFMYRQLNDLNSEEAAGGSYDSSEIESFFIR